MLADGWVGGGIARFSRPTPLKLLHCGKETALPAFRLGRSIGAIDQVWPAGFAFGSQIRLWRIGESRSG
jgi:hypothetical protein